MSGRSQDDGRQCIDSDPTHPAVTPEVGSEGGTGGDVEVDVKRGPGRGSEATETWQPAKQETEIVRRDEHGEGRSP